MTASEGQEYRESQQSQQSRQAAQPAAARLDTPVAEKECSGGRESDSGMTTAEYAVGTVAAVGFAGLLYKVVTSAPVSNALSSVIERALSVSL